MYSNSKDSINRFGDDLEDVFSKNKFVILLCGPSMENLAAPGAQLRKDLNDILQSDNFEVVLGEDDGLEQIRENYSVYAHENELHFINRNCNAVVLIADSVGSFCELGLFSYSHVHQENRHLDFILILNESFKEDVSYLNEGPAAAMDDFGKVFYVDFSNFKPHLLLKRLRRRRSAFVMQKASKTPKATDAE